MRSIITFYFLINSYLCEEKWDIFAVFYDVIYYYCKWSYYYDDVDDDETIDKFKISSSTTVTSDYY